METRVRDITKLEVETLAQYVCAALAESGVCGRIVDDAPHHIEVSSFDDELLGAITVESDGTRVYRGDGLDAVKLEKILLSILQDDGQLY